MGLKRNNEMRELVCNLYREGKSVKEIGKIIGRNQSLVFKWVKQAGIPIRANKSQVEAAWKTRLLQIRQSAFSSGDEATHWGNHPEVNRWKARAYYYANHEASKARSRECAKANYIKKSSDPEWRKARLKRHAEYMRENPRLRAQYLDRIKKSKPHLIRQWRKNARSKPKSKIVNNLRRRLRELIHGRVGIRSYELVGCNHEFLIKWLEGQFKRGMTWANYGIKWHVDHIQPCAVFDLTNMGEAKRCFHYSNLRPLWAEINMAKADTIVPCQPEFCMSI